MDEEDAMGSWNLFVGFTVIDEIHGNLGQIVAVDDSTMNVLFVIEKDGEEVLLPAHEEFLKNIDAKGKIVYAQIPEGLLE